ncbi:uncharacterized protein Z519_05549 [Cladophialophora bantiana CBS 173.52]|uniref:Uncharacterized protein n=1 Tax=Cladophialophora bantiana (strain ATCC 10958 / CBS 173.52 / CDC B-1940 / NIH 8579) TaxID=1442370 RepID=A0A0D2HLN8_CLAB1|nr:uncharacterized protein Z519_05549 [Cladophialophora bantiana CBS 173.52]KIW94233.1 hypothetical protein Z519_05549 [Cladophialophora bantiana CBS 173.52]
MGCICSKKNIVEDTPAPRPVNTPSQSTSSNQHTSPDRTKAPEMWRDYSPSSDQAYWRAVRLYLDLSSETSLNRDYHRAVRAALDLSSDAVQPHTATVRVPNSSHNPRETSSSLTNPTPDSA